VICLLFLSTTVDAQITETIQKLLPATVAVELKAKRSSPQTDDQSLYKVLTPSRQAARPIEKQTAQQNLAAQRQYLATIQAFKQERETQQERRIVQLFQVLQQKQFQPLTKSLSLHKQAEAQLEEQLAQKQSRAAAKKVDAVSYVTDTVVSADGLIVTMLGSEIGSIKVTLNNGQELPARLVAVDRRSGLQLLQVDSQDLPHVKLFVGDVLLGGQVATVMCTDVSDRAAATGIITATGRSVGDLAVEVLQTDLQIDPMSAGAPLANLRGELIGIFVAKKDNVAGLSFAVPSKHVHELLESGKKDGAIVLERGFFGIRLDDAKKADGTPYILQVIDESPAANAGFEKGDTIVKVDGEITATSDQVVRAVGRHKAGDKITITSERDGATREFVVTLEALPKANPKTVYILDAANQAIQIWRPGHIVIPGERIGDIKVWTPKTTVREFPYKVTKPDQADLKANAARYKVLIENYYRAVDANGQFGVGVSQPAIRVERSDVEKQLAELTEQVKSLQAAVQKLTAALNDEGDR
jgi:S1-C subfamily serine protease